MGALEDALGSVGAAKAASTAKTVKVEKGSAPKGGGALAAALGGGKPPKDQSLAKSESSLNSALSKIEASGDEGATKKAKGIAGKVGSALSPVVKALQVLDVPRATLASGLGEWMDLVDGGENTHGFVKGIKAHEGVGDLFADSDLPINLKRALGFVGDVAIDPLTYLAPEAKLAHGSEAVARELVTKGAETLGREVAENAATKVLRGGVGALSKEELASIGAKGGLKLNVPGTGRLGRAIGLADEVKQIPLLPFEVTSKLGAPVAAAKNAVKDSKVGEFLGKALGGEDAALKSAMRSGDRAVAPAALESLTAKKAGRGIMKATEGKLVNEVGTLLKGFDKSEGETLVRALEGDARATAKLGSERVEAVRGWLDRVRVEADLPHIDDYFPRVWTPELRDFLNPEGKMVSSKVAAEKVRELKNAGDTFLGEQLHGATQAELRDSIEQIAKDKFGPEYKKVFSTDPFEVLPLYAKSAARKIGRNEVSRRLVESGVFHEAPVELAEEVAPKAAVEPSTRLVDVSQPGVANDLARGAEATPAAPLVQPDARAFETPRAVQNLESEGRRLDGIVTKLSAEKATLTPQEVAEVGGLFDASKPGASLLFEKSGAGAYDHAAAVVRQESVAATAAQNQARLAEIEQELASATGRRATILGEVQALRQQAADATTAALQASDEATRTVANLSAQADMSRAAMVEARQAPLTVEAAPKVLRAAKQPELIASAPLEALGAFKSTMSPDDLADALVRVQYVSTPEGWQGFLKLFDGVTNLWKGYAILTPGFHVRNFMGGMFNNSLAGVEYGSYRKFMRAYSAFEKGGIDAVRAADRQTIQSIVDMGILNGGQTASELAGEFAGTVEKGNFNPLSRNNKALKYSFQKGEKVENVLRGTLAYDVLSKGRSVDDALADVAKFHFDYSDLSGFERNVAKRLIPFYTWTRKNFPLQIEQMAKQPGIYAKYLHAKRNIELGTDEEGVVPSYFGDLLGIHTPFSIGGADAYLTPDLPFKDLTKTVNFKQTLASLNPILKTPLELTAGKQFFSDIPFTGKYGEAPATWSRIPGLMQGLQVLGKAKKNESGQWIMSDKDTYTVESFIPVLGRARRLGPSEDKYQERVVSSWLGTMFGTGVRTNTLSSQKGELYRRQDKLAGIVNDLKARGVIES